MAQFTPGVGIVFKSYEPLDEMAAYAQMAESVGLSGGMWVAEGYHWFRNFGKESRGAFVTLSACAAATKTIPLGLGITTPYIRHPTIIAAEAAALDEFSRHRFTLGLGVGAVGVRYLETDLEKHKPVPVHREAVQIIRGVLSGKAIKFEGDIFKAEIPAVDPKSVRYRPDLPVYIAATGPMMNRLVGRIGDGLLLPGMTSSGFVRIAQKRLQEGFDKVGRTPAEPFPVGAVILAAVSKHGDKAREATRAPSATYVVNKVKNIQNDEILTSSGVDEAVLGPMRDAVRRGEQELTHMITDDFMRQFNVVSGTPDECVEILQDLIDAGLNLPLMEVVGTDVQMNLETVRLLGEEVVPRLKLGVAQ
ncbi:MAG: LLM class flavin-dependent oxidoreductase [Gammaproteobacteria bacterium]|nr:LLM class flavin-dependent oxidoreductase [Gammaproteobacteria bacterium]